MIYDEIDEDIKRDLEKKDWIAAQTMRTMNSLLEYAIRPVIEFEFPSDEEVQAMIDGDNEEKH